MNKKIISIHIPKCAGTSFKKALVSKYNVLVNDQGAFHFDKILNENYKKYHFDKFRDSVMSKKWDILHGHFFPGALNGIEDLSYAIWIRNPIERLASHYYFWQRLTEYSIPRDDDRIALYQNRIMFNVNNPSLEEFCLSEEHKNTLSRYLLDFDIELLDFVGDVDNYDTDINKFSKTFGLSELQTYTINNNTNNKKKSYIDDENLYDKLYEFHKDDMKLYEKLKSKI